MKTKAEIESGSRCNRGQRLCACASNSIVSVDGALEESVQFSCCEVNDAYAKVVIRRRESRTCEFVIFGTGSEVV